MAAELLLNLGSGPYDPEGWVNIDRSPSMILGRVPGAKRLLQRLGVLSDAHMASWPPSIRRINLVKGLPFPNDTVSAIYSSHTLEHLYLYDAQRILDECKRVMTPGGYLRLALPDGERWAQDLLNKYAEGHDCPGLTYNTRLASHHLARPVGLRTVTALASGSLHRWQPTRDLIQSLLERAGFEDIAERRYREGGLPDLEKVESRTDSMFFEATA